MTGYRPGVAALFAGIVNWIWRLLFTVTVAGWPLKVAVVLGPATGWKKNPPVSVTFALAFVGDKLFGVTAITAGRTGATVSEEAGDVSPLLLRT